LALFCPLQPFPLLLPAHLVCPSHPFCYFPVFYAMKGVVEDRPWASTFEKYKRDLWENCKALWMIWVPAQMVNFALVPRHLRIPFGEDLPAARAPPRPARPCAAAA
jgi:hypothetical protein